MIAAQGDRTMRFYWGLDMRTKLTVTSTIASSPYPSNLKSSPPYRVMRIEY